MVMITAAEKEAIVKKFPKVHIARTMKNDSKRHHYYCVEEREVMNYLRTLRGWDRPKNRRKQK